MNKIFLKRLFSICMIIALIIGTVSFQTVFADPVNNYPIVITVAGNGVNGYSGQKGIAIQEPLWNPSGVALDSQGNLYIADTDNNLVRMVDHDGKIKTVAGTVFTGGSNGEGIDATWALLNKPSAIAIDKDDNLYICDEYNFRIRKVEKASGKITTIAGNGTQGNTGDGGPATSAQFNIPKGITIDKNGNLYIADAVGFVRMVDKQSGIITTVAGAVAMFEQDNIPATQAKLTFPTGVAVDGNGNIYIAELKEHRIRFVDKASGMISTIAGQGESAHLGDGGPAKDSYLVGPYAISLTDNGELYISSHDDLRIRKIDQNGIITTIAGYGAEGFSGDGGPALTATFKYPTGIVADNSGNVYIADSYNQRIRKIYTPLSISQQPTGGTVYAGDSMELSVAATGSGELSYQWCSNDTNSNSGGTAIENATSPTYSAPTSTVGTKYYYCSVTNTDNGMNANHVAVINSNAAKVVVNEALPTNAATPVISVEPTEAFVNINDNAVLSAAVGNGTKLSYQWYSNTTNSNSGGSLVEGATSPIYLAPTGTVGTAYYYCVVTNTDESATTNKTTSSASNAAKVVVSGTRQVYTAKPVIKTQPVGKVVNTGNTYQLSIEAIGGVQLTYQWYENTQNSNVGGTLIEGATQSTYTTDVLTTGTIYYYCVVTNTDNAATGSVSASVASVAAKVEANPGSDNAMSPYITGMTKGKTIYVGDNYSLGIAVSGGRILSYQWYSSPTDTYSNATPIKGATNILFYVPSNCERVTYYYCEITNTDLSLSGNKSATGVSPFIRMSVKSVAPQSADVPNFSIQPPDKIINVGGTADLSVEVDNGSTLSYQWYSNTSRSTVGGTLIPNATTATYSLPTDKGTVTYYYCIVTNTDDKAVTNKAMSEASRVAKVTVVKNADAPVITAQSSGTKSVNPGEEVTLFVTAGGGVELSYQWYKTNAPNSVGTSIDGATESTYKVPTNELTTAYYYCVVTNTDVNATGSKTATASSTPVLVTVVKNAQIPEFSTQPADITVNRGESAELSVVISNGATLRYQWYSNTTNSNSGGSKINGATSSIYYAPSSTIGTNCYYCEVLNEDLSANGIKNTKATSNVATVTVVESTPVNAATPIFANHPENQSTYVGASATLGVLINNGISLSYQWYSNTTNSNVGGSKITGATSRFYVAPTSVVGTKYYYCVVTNTDNRATGNQTATAVSNAAKVVVKAAPIITTYAGTGNTGTNFGPGPATSINILNPSAVVLADNGDLYFADTDHGYVCKVDKTTQALTIVAGWGYTSIPLGKPMGLAFDSEGNLYIADKDKHNIFKLEKDTGNMVVFAGSYSAGFSGDDGSANQAKLSNPYGVTVDASGNVYIADTGNSRIRKVDKDTGIITTVAGSSSWGYGGDGGDATSAKLGAPSGVDFDKNGNMYIAEYYNNRIRKVDTNGIITTMVGTGTAGFSGDGGDATMAQLNKPYKVSFDSNGNLFIADNLNSRIRKVDTSGVITTVAGIGSAGFDGDGGPATLAGIKNPVDCVMGVNGDLFIADSGNNRIRKVSMPTTAVTVSGIVANDKEYDGTTGGTLSGGTLNGVAVGDDVSLSTESATVTFSSKNVGNNIPVTISGLSLKGEDAYKYKLTLPTDLKGNIKPKAITITMADAEFEYDGQTKNLSSANSENVEVTYTNNGQTYAGTYTVSASPADSNYKGTATAILTITPKTITPSVTPKDKIYDGTLDAACDISLSGIIGEDYVSATCKGKFSDARVGANKPVNYTDITLTGMNCINYKLSALTAAATASITPKSLIPQVTVKNKPYDGTVNVDVEITLLGVIGGDRVTASGKGEFVDSNIGKGKVVNVTDITIVGTDSGNYTLSVTSASVTADITQPELTVSGLVVNDKIYDGTTIASISGGSLVGIKPEDNVSLSLSGATAVFSDKNVGNGKAVTISGLALTGSDASKYALKQPTGVTGNITPKALTPSATAMDKVYDSTTTATVTITLGGIVVGDLVTATGVGIFTDENAAAGKTVSVTGITLGGANSGNYSLSSTNTTATASITQKAITITMSDASFVYDGNAKSLSAANIGNVKMKYDNNGKIDAGKYTITASADDPNYSGSKTANLTITPKALTISGLTAISKTYDGTTVATLTGGTLVGKVGADDVSATMPTNGTFANKNIGAGVSVAIANIVLSGAKASNYTLIQPTGLAADIIAETTNDLTISVSGVRSGDQPYDNNWTRNEISVNLTGTAPSNVKKYQYSKDNGETWIDLETDVLTINETTDNVFIFRSISNGDIASNPSAPIVIKVDKSKPFIGNVTGNPTTPKNTEQVITFTAEDLNSGIDARSIKVQKGETVIQFTQNNGVYSFMTQGNGEYEINVSDNVANNADKIIINVVALDFEKPVISMLSPTNNDVNVDTGSFTVTFSEKVKKANINGDIVVHREDGTVFERIDVHNNRVKITNEQMTVSFSKPLERSARYYVTIDNGIVTDLTDNSFNGISNSTAFTFTTSQRIVNNELVGIYIYVQGEQYPAIIDSADDTKYSVIAKPNADSTVDAKVIPKITSGDTGFVITSTEPGVTISGDNIKITDTNKEQAVVDIQVKNIDGTLNTDKRYQLVIKKGSLETRVENLSGTNVESKDLKGAMDVSSEVSAGKQIELLLNVSDNENTLSTEQKSQIQEAVGNQSVAMYLDIDLILKNISDNTITPIYNTQNPVTIMIEIPSSKRGGSNYKVIRSHNGVIEAFDAAVEGNYLVVTTDRFSQYAIAYTKPAPEKTSGGSAVHSGGTMKVSSTSEHASYIKGYPDNTFRSESSITRAEVTSILSRLSGGYNVNQYYANSFADVEAASWYANAVGFGSQNGLVKGYEDGTFMPENEMTRAEFAAIIARFKNLTITDNFEAIFNDVNGHWAKGYTLTLYALGWISGYEDGTFKPDAPITRAEVVKIINAAMGRTPSNAKVDLNIGSYQIPFTDVDKSHWAYYDILEAAISHSVSDFN